MLLLRMQSLNYTNSHATLLSDASRAASTLRTACSRRRSPELRMKPESLLTCEAVAFVQVGQSVPRAAHNARDPVELHGGGIRLGGAPLRCGRSPLSGAQCMRLGPLSPQLQSVYLPTAHASAGTA